MKVHILRTRPSPEQIDGMLEALKTYIKVAVDVERQVLAGGVESGTPIASNCF